MIFGRSFLRALIPLVLAAAAVGCAADDDTSYPNEIVTQGEWSIALAMIREGDSIYVPRVTRLDRIDARTGVITRLAGREWAECPRDPTIRWMPTPLDNGYPNLVVRGTTFYLIDNECGLWSFDVTTGQKRMLMDPSFETKKKKFEAEGIFPEGAMWNGKTGPDWSTPWGMTIASDGDGLVGCFSGLPVWKEGVDYFRRLVLWSIGLDGSAREQLVEVDQKDGENYCRHVIPDETSILFSTDRSILRWDRKTRVITKLVSGFKHGSEGLAQDATSVFYIAPVIVSMAGMEVMRLPRDGGGPALALRPALTDPRDPPRVSLTLDGDYVYFHERYTLKRMSKSGEGLMDFATGSDSDWVVPTTLGFGDEHVYFQKLVEGPTHEEVDPESGETIEVKRKGVLRRARR